MSRRRVANGCFRWVRLATSGLALAALAPTGFGCRSLKPPTPAPPPPEWTAHCPPFHRPVLPSATAGDRAKVPAASVEGTPAGPLRPAGTVKPSVHQALPPEPCGRLAGAASGEPVPTNLVDLGAALRLAGTDNPTINLAQEQVREARAGQLVAHSLWLPSVTVGGSFRLHRGALLSSSGILRMPNSQSLYLGAGTGTGGAGTPTFPGHGRSCTSAMRCMNRKQPANG